MSLPQASAASLFHLIGSLQTCPEIVHQPQITLTGLEIWHIPWCSGLCYLITTRLLETKKRQDWCQVGTITRCPLPLIILSGSSMKCECVWSHTGVTVLDTFPCTSPCLEVCSFSYHHLPASPTQVLSLLVYFSGAITELFFGRKAWRCYPGKIIKIDQHPFTWAMSQVVSLHFYLISPSSVTEFSRSLSFEISVGKIFFLRTAILSWYHQTENSEQSTADSRAVLSRLAGDFPRVGIQSSILGES